MPQAPLGLPPIHMPASNRPSFEGLFFDELDPASAWIRETGSLRLTGLAGETSLKLSGRILPHAGGGQAPGLELCLDGQALATLPPREPGEWSLSIPLDNPRRPLSLQLRLRGVWTGNALAWLGRLTGLPFLARHRRQEKNRRLRITRVETGSGVLLCDFSGRHAPFPREYLRSVIAPGINVVGFICAELGIGESARCMLRAADAEGLPAVPVALRLHCKNPSGDLSFAGRLSEANPQPVNVFHIDPPVSRDIDHHHGPSFRKQRYNIGYWAWELPDFPDAWHEAFMYFDEIWCPSDFVRESIAMKSPLPVLTMPHAIHFERPKGDTRARFGLPKDRFLFLFLYDLNSYSERKNPRAVVQAFRESGLAGRGASLVIKVHNREGNEGDFLALKQAVEDLPGTQLLSETLSRGDLILLEASCDAFVSLHRSEGFGLSIAECMYLGKPVISTDWSASSEYLDQSNGCPVNYSLVQLERSHGPYGGGSHWAQPDTAHAAWWMRRLFEDAPLCANLGAAAKAQIERRFSPRLIGRRYRSRLEEILLF